MVNKGREVELEVLSKGIESLRRITGAVPKGYRAPAGNAGPHTLELLLDHGFTYDSSLVGGDEPYWIKHARNRPRPLLEVPFSWEMTDTSHFLFNYHPYYTGMSSQNKVYEIWQAECGRRLRRRRLRQYRHAPASHRAALPHGDAGAGLSAICEIARRCGSPRISRWRRRGWRRRLSRKGNPWMYKRLRTLADRLIAAEESGEPV